MKNVFYLWFRNIYRTYTLCMGAIGFLIHKNMGIDIKIVTLAMLEPKLWPNMWFRCRPFWMCPKTRLRGGKNWTPKSIWTTEMAKLTYCTRLLWCFTFKHFQKCIITNLTLSSLNVPLSSSSTTSRKLLSQFSTCSGWRWFDVGEKYRKLPCIGKPVSWKFSF